MELKKLDEKCSLWNDFFFLNIHMCGIFEKILRLVECSSRLRIVWIVARRIILRLVFHFAEKFLLQIRK